MGTNTHILLLFCLVGLAHTNCRARPPSNQTVTTAAPIDDQPPTNKGCMIPFLSRTRGIWMIEPYSSYLYGKQPVTYDDCSNRCLNNDTCSAMEWFPKGLCYLYRSNQYMTFGTATCAGDTPTFYLKALPKPGEECTPLLLYRAWYNSEVVNLPNGEKYTIGLNSSTVWNAVKVAG